MKNPWPELIQGVDVLVGHSVAKNQKLQSIKKRERLHINFGSMETKASTLGRELVEISALMLFSEKHNFVSEIRFPSAIPQVWNKNKNLLELIHLFLTGKKISFKFPSHKTRTKTKIFDAEKEKPVSKIALFSGGLDSLATYYLFKNNSEKPFFVNVTLNSRVHYFLKKIKEFFSNFEVYELAYSSSNVTSFGKHHVAGDLQQTRGFLFLTTAAMVAEVYDSNEIIVGETGPIMYQPKFNSTDVVTRTTHPVLMRLSEKLFLELFHKNITILTPFENKTKAEMIYSLPIEIRRNYMDTFDSCMVSREKNHEMCGRCYSCVVRRLSSIAVGAEDNSGYAIDIFNQNDVKNMIHLSSLLEFCLKIQNFSGLSQDVIDSIREYEKEDLFLRFSQDILSGVYLISSTSENRFLKDFSEKYLSDSGLKQKIEQRIKMLQLSK